MPLAFKTFGNPIELNHKLKLNSKKGLKGSALVLTRPIKFPEFEVQVEYTINTPSDMSRGTLIILIENEFRYEDFSKSHFGYRSDYKGIGIYIFLSQVTQKWHFMTL